ncbi:unnamed protein product [Ectocarpus sp. CCAP 1310/34]|nr:unnamed protein product [Ectocarpus sp. CCAP 1310/34]
MLFFKTATARVQIPDSASNTELDRRQWLKQQSKSRRRRQQRGSVSRSSYDSDASSLAGDDSDTCSVASTSSRLSIVSTPEISGRKWQTRKQQQQQQTPQQRRSNSLRSSLGRPAATPLVGSPGSSVSGGGSRRSSWSTASMSAVGTRPRGTLTRTNSSSSLSSELSMTLLRWCAVCEGEFTQLRRPHRCRRCLEPVCAPCSPARLPVPGAGSLELKRTCKLCVGDDAAAAPRVGAATPSRRPKAVGAAAAPSPRVARITKRRSASMGSAARAPVGILSKPVYADTAGLNPAAAAASSPGPADKVAGAAVEPGEVEGVSGTGGGGGSERGIPAASPVPADKARGSAEPKPQARGGSTPRSRFGILSRVASVVTAGLYPAAASSPPSPAGKAGETAAVEPEAVGVSGKDGGDGSESGMPAASSPGPGDKAGDSAAVEPKAEASVGVVAGNDSGGETGANAGMDDDEEEFFLAADDVEADGGGGGAAPPPRAASPLEGERAAAPPPPLAPKGDDYGAGAAAGTPGAAGSPPAVAAGELDTAGSSPIAPTEENGAADAERRGVSLRLPPTALGSRSQAAEPTASDPLHEIFAPRENSGAYADAMEEEVEMEEEEETVALELRAAGGEGPAATAAVASEATEAGKPAGTGLAAAAAAIAEDVVVAGVDGAENASTMTAPPADAVDGEPVNVGIAEELGDGAVAGVSSPPPVDVNVFAPLADSDVVPSKSAGALGADGAASVDPAVGVDDAPPPDPTSAASVPDEASSELGGGASGEHLLPVAVANAGVGGAADVALLGANGAAAVVGPSGDEPHDVEVPSGGVDASPSVADEPSVSVVGKTSPHRKTQALGDDGVVAPPSLPGGVSTSVGGDAPPDAVGASGEVSALPHGSGATRSAPEGSITEVVIPVSPGVDTESPDGPGSVGAAPDVSVSASPAVVAAGLDATSGNSVAEAPAPGVGSVPEVSDYSAVPPDSSVSSAGEGVELPGETAVLPEHVAGGAVDDHEPSADSTGQMAAIRDTLTTPSSVVEVSASDPAAAAAADVPSGDASATMPPDMNDVEGGDAPPVAGLAAASSDAAAVGDDKVPREGGAGDLSALHGSDGTQPPPPPEEIPVLPSVASSSPPDHDDAGEGEMPAPENGDASVPDTAAVGGGVVPLPDTAADSAEPPVDGDVPMTASSLGVPGVESNDLGSTPDAASSATGTAPAPVPGLPSDDAGVPPADVVVPTADNEIPASVGGTDRSSVTAAGSAVLGPPPSAAEVPFSGDIPPLSVAIREKGVAEVGGGGDASDATAAVLDLGGAAINDAVAAGQSNDQPDDAERQTPLVDAGLAATFDAPSSASKKGKKSKFGFRTPSFLRKSKSSTSEVPASDASGGVPSSAGDTPLSSVSLETPSGGVHASTPSSSAQSVGGDPTTEEGASTGASAEAKKPKRGLFGGLSLKKSSSKGKSKLEVPEVASPNVLAVSDTGSSLPQAPEPVAEPTSAADVSVVPDGGTASLPEASGGLLVPGTTEASIDGDLPVPRGGVSVPEISASLPEESGDVAVPALAVPGTTEDPTGVHVPVPCGNIGASMPEGSGDLSVPGATEVSIGGGVPVPSGDASMAPDIGVSMPEASGDLTVPGTKEVSIGGEVPVPSSDISASLAEASGEISVPGTMEASIGGDLPVPSGGVSVPDISASLPEESGDLAVPALVVPGTTGDPTGVDVPVPSGDMSASLPEASGDLAVPGTAEASIGTDVPGGDVSVVPDISGSLPEVSGDLSVRGTKEAPIGGDLPVPSSDISASLPEASGDLSVPDTQEASIGGDVPVPSGYLSVPDMSASPPEDSGDVVVPDTSASITGVSGTTAAEPGADLAAVSGVSSSASPMVSGDPPVPDLTDSSPPGISGDVAAPDADLSVPKTSDDEQPSAAEIVNPGILVVGEVSELADDGALLAEEIAAAAAATGAAVTAGLSEHENGEKLGPTSAVVKPSGDPAFAADGVPPVLAVVPAEPSATSIAMGDIPTVLRGEAERPSVAVEEEKMEELEECGSAEQEGGSPEVVARAPTFTGTSIAMGDIPAAGARQAAVGSPSAAVATEEKEEEPEKGGPPEVVTQASVSTVGGDDGPPSHSEAAAATAAIVHTGGSAASASAGQLQGTKGSAAGEGAADAVNQPVEEPTVLPLVDGLPEDGAEEEEAAGVTTADGTPGSAAVDKVAVGGTADNIADNMAAADQAMVTGGGAVTVGALVDEEVSMAAGKAGLEGDDDSLASWRGAVADGSNDGVSRPALSDDDPRSTAAAAAVVVPEVPENALPPPAACVEDEVAPVKTIVTAVSGGSSSNSSSSADGMPLPAASLDGEGATAPEALSGSRSGSTDELLMPAASLDEEGAGRGVTNPILNDGDSAVPPGAADKEQHALAVEEQSAVAAGLEVTHSSPVDDSSAHNAAASAAVEVTRTARTTVDEEGGDLTPEISIEKNGGDGAEESAAAAPAAVGPARLGYSAGEAYVELNKSSSPIASPPHGIDGADERGDDMATGAGAQEGTQESGQGPANRDSVSPGLPTGYATGGYPTEESMPSPSANQVPSTSQVRADVGGGIDGRAPAVTPPSAGGTVREPVRRSGTAAPPNSARGVASGAGEKDWLDELIDMFSDKCSTCVVDDAL